MLPDHVGQQVGKTAAASHETTGTIDIEHADHGMHIGGCPSSSASVKGIHVGHHTAQFGVCDIFGYKLVGCHEEFVRVVVEVGTRRTEIEQVEFLCQCEDGLDIALQVLTLLREGLGQRVHEALPALSNGVMLMILREIQMVRTIIVHIAQVHLVFDT